MPSATPTLKRQNHRIHPCTVAGKNDLLNHLIRQYAGKSILVVTSGDPAHINVTESGSVTLMSDPLLAKSPDLTCEILISYDLPDKAIVYMSRFARAREYALILLGAEDQKFLYPIETLLGRTITQEAVSGFEPDFGIAVEQKIKEEAKARREEREARAQLGSKPKSAPKRDEKSRRDDRSDRRPDFKREERGGKEDIRPPKKPFSDGKKTGGFEEQKGKPRFIGKDENGKPIFEGKTRERNHYIDGTPRSDAEKAKRTPYVNKPKFFDQEKQNTGKPKLSDGEKTPYNKENPSNDGKKPFNAKKPFDKDKKPYDGKKSFGDKDKKPYGGTKKPYDKSAKSTKPSSDYAKPPQSEAAVPKRPPRRISVKSLKPPKESE